MFNLVGEYAHKMDSKGRVSFPATFRKGLDENADLVIAPSLSEKYLRIYLRDDYVKWVDGLFEGIGGYKENNEAHVELRSELMGEAQQADIDSSGRIQVCADQRALAGLGSEVYMVGNGNCVEVWSAERRAELHKEARSKKRSILFANADN